MDTRPSPHMPPPPLYLHIVHGQVAAGGPHRPAALEVPLRQLRARRVQEPQEKRRGGEGDMLDQQAPQEGS